VTDDGIRVLVDGTQVVDGWFYQAPTTYTAGVRLSEGPNTLVVEYFGTGHTSEPVATGAPGVARSGRRSARRTTRLP
jgi:hypothetical protein